MPVKQDNPKMVYLEFLRDYLCCWKKGDKRDCLPHFADTVIKLGVAKRIEKPKKNKMVDSPGMAKGVQGIT